jgi:hypothetical protein
VRGQHLAPAAVGQQSFIEWNGRLSAMYPHRREESNGFDDDCDLRVDELEHYYQEPPLDPDHYENSIPYAFVMNADIGTVTIRIQPYRLLDFPSVEYLLPYGAWPPPPPPTCGPTLSYAVAGASSLHTGAAEACGDASPRVYVLLFGYERSGQPLLSVDASGAASTAPALRFADRLVADPYVLAAYDVDPIPNSQMRVHTINQALFEWAGSQLDGQIGFQAPPDRAHPMGTKYLAIYGDLWCSEFAAWVYGEATPYPYFSEVKSISDFEALFLREEARYTNPGPLLCRIGIPPGDYLAVGAEEKPHHSAIYMATYDGPHPDPEEGGRRVFFAWDIGGNESGAWLCYPWNFQCGSSAVFFGPQEIDGQYHKWLGDISFADPNPM